MMGRRKRAETRGQPRRRVVPVWRSRPVLMAGAGLLAIGVGAAGWFAWQAELPQRAADGMVQALIDASAGAGFVVRDVFVVGRTSTPKDTLLAALAVKRGTPILNIDLNAARDRVQALPWVREASVRRLLPNTVVVEIVERKPLALWQFHKQFALIDEQGDVILRDDVSQFSNLMVVVGEDAPANAAQLVKMLATEPDLMTRVKAAAQTKVRNGLIAALDIGTTKACCLIARAPGGGEPFRVVGIGHHASQGVRHGALVDLEGAEATIRTTVEAAERMAGDNVRGVVVNVSTGQPRSRLVAYEVSVAGHEIGDADLRRILDPTGVADSVPPEHDIVHVIPVGYAIDGCRGVRDPRGMFGQRLGVNLHLITASAGAVRNLATCVTRCHLEVEGKVVSPYAAALGCLVEDETQLGVTLIDMGGGVTSVAVFFDSELIYTDSIPLGGLHVTRDLARGLSTPMAQAERIKTLYGSCQPSPSDGRQTVEVPPIADDGASESGHVPRSLLVGIIRPRLEEIFEMVRSRLKDAGYDRVAGRRAVLTGGACQLAGAQELAGQVLDKQVRIGRPRGVDGLSEATSGPAFATCAGLLRFAANQAQEGVEPVYRPTQSASGRFGRFGQWLRENF